MSKIKTLSVFLLSILLSFSAGYLYQRSQLESSPLIYANVFVLIEKPTGHEYIGIGSIMVHNTLVDQFEQEARDLFADGGSADAYKYIALGNSSIEQTKTKLDTEVTSSGFERALGTVVKWTYDGDYSMNVTKKFTATGSITINAVALHKSAVGETADACSVASLGGYQAFQSGWNCTIVYVLRFNFN